MNGGMKYVLMVIDCFSKFGYGIPLRTKTGPKVAEAFKLLFKTPRFLWVDRGMEFYNTELSSLLKKHGIKIYSTSTSTRYEYKVSVVERWNRTIKTKLWKYFTANGTYKWRCLLYTSPSPRDS